MLVTIERTPGAAFEVVEESELIKTEGVDHDDGHEYTTWIEYRFPGQDRVVHRSVHVTLREGVSLASALGQLG